METAIAESINNSCVHILNKYELTIVRQLDLMLLEWRGKEPGALSNGPVIVIHWWLIVLILKRLRYASADQ